MDLAVDQRGGVLVVRAGGPRLDAAGVLAFKERLRQVVGGASGRVVLDLGAVTFLDSSGLGAIVAARKFLPDGTALELAALTPAVERVFRLTRMDSVFSIHPRLQDALLHAG